VGVGIAWDIAVKEKPVMRRPATANLKCQPLVAAFRKEVITFINKYSWG
jgi:hypothetical protein